MGTLVNGIGIFVLTLGAVVVGGTINTKLHPMPDFRLDKDGKITAIIPQPASGGHGEGERQGVGLPTPSIRPSSSTSRRAPPCASCRFRCS